MPGDEDDNTGYGNRQQPQPYAEYQQEVRIRYTSRSINSNKGPQNKFFKKKPPKVYKLNSIECMQWWVCECWQGADDADKQ